ncbi:MAG: hypothetical protein ACO3FK_11785 [Vulcanococcus sp.]
MNPLPDRTVILGMLITLGLVFAVVFWFVRLAPSPEPQAFRSSHGFSPCVLTQIA